MLSPLSLCTARATKSRAIWHSVCLRDGTLLYHQPCVHYERPHAEGIPHTSGWTKSSHSLPAREEARSPQSGFRGNATHVDSSQLDLVDFGLCLGLVSSFRKTRLYPRAGPAFRRFLCSFGKKKKKKAAWLSHRPCIA